MAAKPTSSVNRLDLGFLPASGTVVPDREDLERVTRTTLELFDTLHKVWNGPGENPEREHQVCETLREYGFLGSRQTQMAKDGGRWCAMVSRGDTPEEAIAKIMDADKRELETVHRSITRYWKQWGRPPFPIPGVWRMERYLKNRDKS